MVSYTSPIQVFKIRFFFFFLIAFLITLAISVQVTQQVYVIEDWVRIANKEFNAEAQTRRNVEKAVSVANHEKTQLAEKLKVVESACQSAEAGLKSAKPELRTSASNSTPPNLTLPLSRRRF